MKLSRKMKADALVVGSGLAGIKASKELADQGNSVIMVTKMKVASGSSFYPLKASLGTQVTKDQEDHQLFLDDIEDLGRGMHQPDLAAVYVQEIQESVTEYEDIGVHAKKLEGERKACFANHSRDIYLLSDWDQIRENVQTIFSEYEDLKILEKSVVIKIIKNRNTVVGAILLDENNEFVLVECKAIILASGGFGSIYKHNLNPNDVDGSGHILALEVGARLVNMEFIQFIPGITTPRYKTLFGEQTLMYCDDIVDDHGQSLLDAYLPKELTKQKCLEIRSTHGPFTHTLESKYFDIAMMKEIIATRNEKGFKLLFNNELYANKEEFYTVYLNWLKEKNIHLTDNEVRIAPFAHASNGGVYIDTYGRTGIDGLYAIGELSCNIEGANRLGGNSTGACMVFGKRAASDCVEYIQKKDFYTITESEFISQLEELYTFNEGGETAQDVTPKSEADQAESIHHMIDKIKEMMWYSGNVVRSEQQLIAAIDEINKMNSNVNLRQLFEHQASRKQVVQLRNFIKLSQLLLKAMLERKESRGAHYREDYPHEKSEYNKRLYISEKEGCIAFHFDH
ncbi:FAD-binding protein [Alkalihalobacterium alkalinitrilicum]|uniref:FAD-binding protein n=1 Tax=Alkalihalobacterium alkalinitrilicum TaxID=427920 RepID=UPI001EE3CCAF|nr:FAD-binding protein [Alkalihalobacterium alkalinitrilicum]